MKLFKRIVSVIIVVSCCMMLMASSVNARELKNEEVVTYATPIDQFSFPEQTEFRITKSMRYFKYNTGSLTAGYTLLRFTNTATGSYCTHSLQSATNGMIYCNITAGTYKITCVGGSSGSAKVVFYS